MRRKKERKLRIIPLMSEENISRRGEESTMLILVDRLNKMRAE